MTLRRIDKEASLSGSTVLLRIDADVAVERGKVVEGTNGRLAKAAVMMEWLRQRGARVVVLAHRGRPGGKRVPALSLAGAAKRLSELLGTRLDLLHDVVGPKVEARVKRLASGEMVMLENVRFHRGEEEDSTDLARAWAKLGDVYVNDAFASAHRRHASVHAIAKLLPSYAGLQLAHEIDMLEHVREPKTPLVVVLGGAKIHIKIGTLRAFLKKKSTVCIGGALAHPFFVAQGISIGRSFVDGEDVPLAKELLKKFHAQIVLPTDVVVTSALRKGASVRTAAIADVGVKEMIVDMGRVSIEHVVSELARARTIVWNGPLGVCERKEFAKGTSAIARAIAARTGRAMTVVGGGDTVPALESFRLSGEFSLVSTGGGAMMTFLAGEPMPGLEYLTSRTHV